jgi:hypothetical protein
LAAGLLEETNVTEVEWLACTDPEPMVKYLRRRKASGRKWRLTAVASSRKRWHLLSHPLAQAAILVAERFADGEVPEAELKATHRAAYAIYAEDERSIFDAERDALGAAAGAAMTLPSHAFNRAIYRMEPAGVCDLLREVFGNPFRPLPPRPEAIVPLAEEIYAGAWDKMPLLGEWLQEKGYWPEGEHCLDPNLRHVKGCCLIDWVLGKS